jgi:hypothetical protein
MACFRLVTFRPELLFNVPRLRRCIADFTVFDAAFPYFAMHTPSFAVAKGVLMSRADEAGRSVTLAARDENSLNQLRPTRQTGYDVCT